MIHVNVRHDPNPNAHAADCIVEVSTDGGGWRTLYVFGLTIGDDENLPRRNAESHARTMGEAWTYAGVEWRGTAFGYGL